ncbi:glycoside hydrolase family 2 TIM barrel-domain containing protein [Kineococcus sp. SYSU DK001]|uniref:glycoside hydrolase family 2 TIM barrel-domain containing protein n=1 Tax=Kineococcus sp. SYSU DK001 TaxID=3383122 RepID=UPI003D7E479E
MSGPRYWESTAPGAGRRAPRAWTTSDAPVLSLNGTWRFRLSPTAAGAGPRVPEPDFDDSGWDELRVPSHWVLEDVTVPWAAEPRLPAPRRDEHGPLYTNTAFPFPVDPPRVPQENPTGDHRLRFTLPPGWLDGRPDAVVLRFQGVDSCARVWLNGTELGWSTGSRLPFEFDVGTALREGTNVLAVRVHRWSAGSYLEDQDMWWLPGIFRDVELLHRPAGAVDDLRVSTGWDAATGTGRLRVDADRPGRVLVPELGVDVPVGTTLRLPEVEPWSAEVPRLYRGTLRTAHEAIDLVIGFRTVSIEDGRLLVNGSPVLLRGVNRHEHHPRRGRALDRATMLADVRAMKRAGVTAVRTSHYPPHPEFLRLCDEIGLWVVLECDLETHGFVYAGWEGNPVDDPAWAGALTDRVRRTVLRDRNSPSVLLWSLANESGSGSQFAALRALVDELDGERPVLYERDPTYRHSDLFALMYPSLEDLAAIGRRAEPAPAGVEPGSPDDVRRRGLPFLLVEYAHAMGNGPGSLAEYQRVLGSSDRFAGGFVWEWVDHGLTARDERGTEFTMHGADVAFRPTGGRFCLDGLLFADRTASPGLHELAAVYAPVGLAVEGTRVVVRNGHDVRDTAHVRFRWRVEADGRRVAEGDLAVPLLAPRARTAVELPEEARAAAQGARGEVWVTVTAHDREPPGWAPGGHVVGTGQGRLRSDPPRRRSGTAPEAGFDEHGALRRVFGIAVDGPRPDLWRAPTENDRGQGSRNTDAASWAAVGLDRLRHRVLDVVRGPRELLVTGRSAPAAQALALVWSLRWTLDADGLDLEFRAGFTGPWDDTPHGHHAVSPPRLGLRLGLPGGYRAVEWFGRGPGESYADSTTAALVGRYVADVDALQTPYPVPQENGNHVGTRSLVLTGPGLPTLHVDALDAGATFDFTARRWTSEDLERARHPQDLRDGGRVWLNLDVAQRGLGSASCGPALPERHRVPTVPAGLRLRLTASG